MIEVFFKNIIDNLGATGLLVVGLYCLLYRPLANISRNLARVQYELSEIIRILEEKTWQK
jgi:hypothetical protein